MKRIGFLSLKRSIVTKLIAMSAVIIVLVAAMVGVNIFFSRRMGELLLNIIERNLVQITYNAQLGRDLSQVFADTNLLISIFLDRPEYLQTTRKQLSDKLALIMESSSVKSSESLANTLEQFTTRLQTVLDQCVEINEVSRELHTLHEDLSGQLQSLEDTVAETMLTVLLEGKEDESFSIEQLSTLLPGYHNAISEIALLLAKIRQEHFVVTEKTDIRDSIENLHQLFEDFKSNLMVVVTTGADFAISGAKLINTVTRYQQVAMTFHQIMGVFQTQTAQLNPAIGQVLEEMRKIDAEIMEKTTTLQQGATGAMDASKRIIVSLSVVILVMLLAVGGYTLLLVKPLGALAAAAEKMADGDIFCVIPEAASNDEIGILSRAFQKLLIYIQEMAAAATEIAQGDLSRQIHPRSLRDVLGQAFQNMSGYLTDMASVATAIAAGDLRQDIQAKSDQDVLGNAFQQMKSLRQLMSQILDGATHLSMASEQLSQISTQMASAIGQASQQIHVVLDRSQQISDNVDAVAVSTEEFASNIREIVKNTDEVAKVTDTAVNIATSAHVTIAELEAQSQEINAVIQVITTISQQTNLLALNATIEAARAGEMGKGFAVVAHEIKELSRETAASADDIIHKLGAIQTGSNNAKRVIHNVVAIIQQIRDLANAIAAAIEQQSMTTQQITRRMEEAAQGSLDITRIIHEIANSAQYTSLGATGVQNSAKDLAALADHLYHLVQQFKIS